jgi:hypothetical protein
MKSLTEEKYLPKTHRNRAAPFFLLSPATADMKKCFPFPPAATNTILNMHSPTSEFGLRRSLGLNFYHLGGGGARRESGRSGAFSNFLRACT